MPGLRSRSPTAPPPCWCFQQGVYVTKGSDVERLSAASSPTPTKDVERYKDVKTAVYSGGLAAARCGLHNLASLRILGRSGGSDGRGLIHITALGHKHPLRHAPRGRGRRLVQSQAGGLAVGGEGGKRRPGAFLACAAAGRQQQLSPYSSLHGDVAPAWPRWVSASCSWLRRVAELTKYGTPRREAGLNGTAIKPVQNPGGCPAPHWWVPVRARAGWIGTGGSSCLAS